MTNKRNFKITFVVRDETYELVLTTKIVCADSKGEALRLWRAEYSDADFADGNVCLLGIGPTESEACNEFID